jgi:hypothetical protein
MKFKNGPKCNTLPYFVSTAIRDHSFQLGTSTIQTDLWLSKVKKGQNSNTTKEQIYVSSNFQLPLLRKIAK